MKWPRLVPELTSFGYEESLKFYVDVLGCRIINERIGPRFAYLDFQGAHLMIEEHHSDGWNIDDMDRPLGRGMNLQFECESVDQLEERIKKAGYSLFREIKEVVYDESDSSNTCREFLVQDPDGYLLRFSEFIED